MKTILTLTTALALLLLSAPPLFAATVVWTTSTVAGPADVSTAGALVGAMNVGVGAATQTINGVAFVADPTGNNTPLTLGNGATVTFGNLGLTFTNFWASADPGGSVPYAAALDHGRFSGAGAGTVTLGGLAVGNTYQVQL